MALDRIVGDLLDVLPAGAVLAVTADHGQVEVGSRAVARSTRGWLEEAAMVSGEGRFRWLHARPGEPAAIDRLAAWRTRRLRRRGVGGRPRSRWRRRAGSAGRCAPEVRARLGDVALIPFEPVAYLDPADAGDARLVCRHGSLTPEEMLVPLLAGHGRLGS